MRKGSIMKKFLAVASIVAASNVFADAKVILTPVLDKEGVSIAMDISSTEAFTGFQFDVEVNGATAIDTSNCLASINKSFAAACNAKGNKVRVIVANLTSAGAEIGRGQTSVGTLRVSGKGLVTSVSNVEVADKSGAPVLSSAQVAE
jgi:hypothetical protein